MSQSPPPISFLDVETAIHQNMATIMAMSELIDATFDLPDKTDGHLLHYSLTDGQVDARLEIMSQAVERATSLREMFQAYILSERERKAAKL